MQNFLYLFTFWLKNFQTFLLDFQCSTKKGKKGCHLSFGLCHLTLASWSLGSKSKTGQLSRSTKTNENSTYNIWALLKIKCFTIWNSKLNVNCIFLFSVKVFPLGNQDSISRTFIGKSITSTFLCAAPLPIRVQPEILEKVVEKSTVVVGSRQERLDFLIYFAWVSPHNVILLLFTPGRNSLKDTHRKLKKALRRLVRLLPCLLYRRRGGGGRWCKRGRTEW